jgi:hypothetical protein
VAEARDDFARTFLLIAPNVIVFERLRTDFEGGRIFRADPVIPPELEIFWRDFQCYMRGESEGASSLGALYLTNIQQFYERATNGSEEPAEMTAVLGQKPRKNRASRISTSESPAATAPSSSSTTKRTIRMTRRANGTRSFARCMRTFRAV